MKIINNILNFFKKLFIGTKYDDCVKCVDRTVCQTTDKNKRYAVIIGVETSKWGSCSGSGKDSNMMFDIISQYTSNIVRLNDKQATVEKVRQALNTCISKVPEDGICYITYSGHGGQTNYKPGASNETDGKDEFLCLFDGYILDDELWTIFNKCKGRILFIVDACHSSTMFSLTSESQNNDDSDNICTLESPFFTKYGDARGTVKMLVISGCDESQVSWGDAQNGGVLTSSLKRAFNKCISYKEWWNKAKQDNSFKKVKQIPICTNVGGFDLNAKVFN